ncbi:protein disulfide-isomerase A3-like [Tribolium madens]|uniref:protein disulfide-isomerase A3-like n=1 Tax=Tribolium madens TaxID=41895 RepID=UPI001CF75881|nr:protein disulfide-isomerase A3-like [Tribolium madens]
MLCINLSKITSKSIQNVKIPVMWHLLLLLLLLRIRPVLPADAHVLSLTDTNFNRQLLLNPTLLVQFFIPWSGMCQKTRPHFAHAAKILAVNQVPVTLAKIDCSGKGRLTCTRKNITYPYPAFHFYRKGVFVKEYTGSRDARSIVKFMRVQVVPDPVELRDVEQFREFLDRQDDVIVVGFFEEESKLRRLFFRVAEEMKERMIFAFTSCEKLILKEGVSNGIVIFRPKSLHNQYDPERVLFTGRSIIGEIKNFITRNYHGLIGHRTPNNRYDFPNPLVIVYHTIDYHSGGTELNYWRYRLIKIAHKYQNFVKIVTSAKDDFEEEIADLRSDTLTPTTPLVVAFDLENQKYVMSDNFTTGNFDNFVENFVNRNLTPYYQSKPIPKENDGPVVIAVTQNFNQMVLNNGKDTLLDLYAPWSLKCQKFVPVLREVAELLEDEDVVFARMDATENEIPEVFSEKGTPNIFWLAKNRKRGLVVYEGERSAEEVVKFVAKKASKELKNYDRKGNPKDDRDEL